MQNVGGAGHRNAREEGLRNVRGAVYLPQKDWNAYQMWANYQNSIVERDLSRRHALPASWGSHSFPYPGRVADAPHDDDSGDRGSKSDDIGSLQEFQSLRESLVERIRRALGLDFGGARRRY